MSKGFPDAHLGGDGGPRVEMSNVTQHSSSSSSSSSFFFFLGFSFFGQVMGTDGWNSTYTGSPPVCIKKTHGHMDMTWEHRKIHGSHFNLNDILKLFLA